MFGQLTVAVTNVATFSEVRGVQAAPLPSTGPLLPLLPLVVPVLDEPLPEEPLLVPVLEEPLLLPLPASSPPELLLHPADAAKSRSAQPFENESIREEFIVITPPISIHDAPRHHMPLRGPDRLGTLFRAAEQSSLHAHVRARRGA